MKKIIVLLLLIMFSICTKPIYALEIEPVQPYHDAELDAQIENYSNIITEALKKGDFKTVSNELLKVYKLKKVGNEQSIKKYNDMVLAFAIQSNLAVHELTRKEKYAKKAYKLSNMAVKDKTEQIYAIQVNIIMSSYKPRLNQMTKAYDLYRATNLAQAENFYPTYEKLYDKAVEVKKQKMDAKKQTLRNAVYYVLLGIASGAKGYADSYNRNRPVYTNFTTTDNYGNTYYTNSYSY